MELKDKYVDEQVLEIFVKAVSSSSAVVDRHGKLGEMMPEGCWRRIMTSILSIDLLEVSLPNEWSLLGGGGWFFGLQLGSTEQVFVKICVSGAEI